ncbi:MAG TPA: polysaccharide lyase family protein [Candidatus Acidoferrum sp.]|nr:polysaccharide lyase family protein [Candidatus Acidoferrum sp.]
MPFAKLNRLIWVHAILAVGAVAPSPASAEPPVTLSEGDSRFVLDNGLVTAQVAKRSGDLISLKYKSLELLEAGSGHPFGYWSHDASRGRHETRITIDPRTNGGALGEVSVKGIYVSPAGGAGAFGGFGRGGTACDVEIRYTLARGLAGVYTYSIFEHRTNYSLTGIGEARFAAKLNPDIFDYLNVDARRRKIMLTPPDWLAGTELNFPEARRLSTGIYRGQVEHKYDYAANQFETRAYGWLGTKSHVGLWFINPSVEYLSGGPTKYELTGHLDISAEAAPVLLNYWRSSHYGGAVCFVTNGEPWTRVVGPFLIYCNAAETPDAMWQDALARAVQEQTAWPYDWVGGVDYPHRADRATVKGQLVLNDPPAPKVNIHHLLVGLTAPDYLPPRLNRGFGGFGLFSPAGGGEDDGNNQPGGGLTNSIGHSGEIAGGDETNRLVVSNRERSNNYGSGQVDTNRSRGGRFGRAGFGGFGGFGGPRVVDWQNDAKHYEFWERGDTSGRFIIPAVRPGTYTLHAIADGVLGEFVLTNVVVTPGQTLDLGKLNWPPVRYGRQLWDIGIPNRTGAEFFKGDDYYHWGWYLEYPKLFPQDVNYIIGRSDFRKDWFFEQVPHNPDPNNADGRGRGRETTWSITFNLPEAPKGRATLRLAICGAGTRTLIVRVNGQPAGTVTNLVYNATINRDGIGGSWSEHDLAFDAALMKSGTNVMQLTIPAGSLTSGVIYDYVRLELDEHALPPQAGGS